MKNQSILTQFHFQSLYRIMLKRIAKGFSTQELSFLIGHESDYIDQVETFQLSFYSDDEIRQIAEALDEPIAADLLVPNADNIAFLTFEAESVQVKQILTRSYYAVHGKDQYQLIFRLTEQVQDTAVKDRVHTVCLVMVKSLIEALHLAGYFHWTRNALEIFQALRPLTSFRLTPFLVKEGLEGMWNEENPKRILDKEVENGLCCGYGEC